jgi:hypothetical protein
MLAWSQDAAMRGAERSVGSCWRSIGHLDKIELARLGTGPGGQHSLLASNWSSMYVLAA